MRLDKCKAENIKTIVIKKLNYKKPRYKKPLQKEGLNLMQILVNLIIFRNIKTNSI